MMTSENPLMLTAQEVYTAALTLSLPERLRLAALILDELEHSPVPLIDPTSLPGYADYWTEEDRDDLRRSSAKYLNSLETV